MMEHNACVCKDKDRYRVFYRYTGTDGKRHSSTKRGFKRRKDALQWKQTDLPDLIRELTGAVKKNEEKTVAELAESYLNMIHSRDRENTYQVKLSLIRQKILPFFGHVRVTDIDADKIETWQTGLLEATSQNGSHYSDTYLYSINYTFTALLNYAVRHDYIASNLMNKVDSIGKKKGKERDFWTPEEYRRFSKAIADKPLGFCAFEILFWTGLRTGELLALTPADLDFENRTLRVNKSYQRIHKTDYITPPKTAQGCRTICLPPHLSAELQEYVQGLHGIPSEVRLFPITKFFLRQEMKRGCAISGVKKITVHGLRHSHISMLANMNVPAIDIARRAGHENVETTMLYTHPYAGHDNEIAQKLNQKMEEVYIRNPWGEKVPCQNSAGRYPVAKSRTDTCCFAKPPYTEISKRLSGENGSQIEPARYTVPTLRRIG